MWPKIGSKKACFALDKQAKPLTCIQWVNVEVSGVFAKVLEPRWIEIKLQGKVEDESFEAKITYCGSFSIYWAEESEKPKRAGPPKAFG